MATDPDTGLLKIGKYDTELLDAIVDRVVEEVEKDVVERDMKNKQPVSESQAIQKFADAMVKKMLLRRGRYKEFGWRDPEYKSMQDLLDHLDDEMEEFNFAGEGEDAMKELVDVANSAFMLWDRIHEDNQKDV